MLDLQKLGNVPAGILERDELAAAGQRLGRAPVHARQFRPLRLQPALIRFRGQAALYSDPISELVHYRRAFMKYGLELRRSPQKRKRSLEIRYLNLVG